MVEVIDSHKSDEIIAVIEQQPQEMRENIREVSVDLWGGFQKVIREVFPNALIVIDRFHVMKLVNKAVNRIRLEREIKGLRNRVLILKNRQDLRPREQSELEEILKKSACLRIAYELKEELREIYEKSRTVKEGIRKIKQWVDYARIILGQVAETIERHLPEICNYFVSRTTSGVMEGLNTRIKLIVRQSYGFKSFPYLREKLLACLFK